MKNSETILEIKGPRIIEAIPAAFKVVVSVRMIKEIPATIDPMVPARKRILIVVGEIILRKLRKSFSIGAPFGNGN